jgi:hypothetical protein
MPRFRNKFSSGDGKSFDRLKDNKLNCVPYVELKTDKGTLKFLIDTGANKNNIKPNHVKKNSVGKTSTIQTVNGTFKVDKFINFNPFPTSKFCQNSEFFIFDFHKFFDGLIGYQFLQKSKAVIDAATNMLKFPDFSIQMKRKFPETRNLNLNLHETKLVELPVNLQNGDFLISDEIEFQTNAFILSGIYRANSGKAIVAVSNYYDKQISFNHPEIQVEINNFETRETCNDANIR